MDKKGGGEESGRAGRSRGVEVEVRRSEEEEDEEGRGALSENQSGS